MFNMALKLFLASTITGSLHANTIFAASDETCTADLATFESDGLKDPPIVSEVFSPELCREEVIGGNVYNICDYFGSDNLDEYTTTCNTAGGDIIPIVRTVGPCYGIFEKTISALCVPTSCDVDEEIAARDAAEFSSTECVISVTRYDLPDKCPSDIQKLTAFDDLTVIFPPVTQDCAFVETKKEGVTYSRSTCEFYDTIDTSPIMEKCSANEGTLVKATSTQICEFPGFIAENMVTAPLCIPNSCVASEILALQEDDSVCTKTVTSDNICGADTARLMNSELPLNFPFPDGPQCVTDAVSTPITTDCDFYNVDGLSDLMNSCTAAGGTLISARQDIICGIEATVTILAPLCIPDNCDPNAFLAQKAADDFAGCDVTVTSPDVTSSPSASPSTSAPTVSAAPTRNPTAVPTALPTRASSSTPTTSISPTSFPTSSPTTASPTSSPTRSSTRSPTTSSPTTTPVLCKKRAFLNAASCASQIVTFEEADYDIFRDEVKYSTDVCETIDGTDTCDIYKSANITEIIDVCVAAGGDSLPFTIRENCSSANTDRQVTGPLCIPGSCDTQTFIDDFLANENAMSPAGCTTTVSTVPVADTRLAYCEKEDCVDIADGSLNECLAEQGVFDRGGFFWAPLNPLTCEPGVPVVEEGTSLTCDQYKIVPEVLKLIDACTAAGGNSINVTQTEVCAYDIPNTKVFIAPMCVAKSCDPYVSLPNQAFKIKSIADPECTITLTADVHKFVDYCGYEEPVAPAITLSDSCESDMMRWETSTGSVMDLHDGAEKICQSTSIDGVFTKTCNYKVGARDKVVDMCADMEGFATYDSTLVSECSVYGSPRSLVSSNTLCLPVSCDQENLLEVLVHQQSITEAFGCKVSLQPGFLGKDAVVKLDKDKNITSNEDRNDTDTKQATDSGGCSFSFITSLALLSMTVLYFAA